MLEKLRKERGDEGFTLIELLVVIIIIGILAAIAIPVFLNQRQKGWDAAVQSDLRNAATAQETFLTEGQPGTYTDVELNLTNSGLKFSGDANYFGAAGFTTVTYDAGNSYCMISQSASGRWFWYDSQTGPGKALLANQPTSAADSGVCVDTTP